MRVHLNILYTCLQIFCQDIKQSLTIKHEHAFSMWFQHAIGVSFQNVKQILSCIMTNIILNQYFVLLFVFILKF